METKKLINKFENLSQKKCDCLGYSCTCFKISRSSAKLFAMYKIGVGTTPIVTEIICLETIKKEIETLQY